MQKKRGTLNAEVGPGFVLHEHFAKHHHFDLRLEHDGVLKSWAVPKGLPAKSGERRLAIAVEDHALEYIGFEGTIPKGEYGAGEVRIRDTGTFVPLVWEADRIEVVLQGKEFMGNINLIRFKKSGENGWLIVKSRQ
ncbi:MAG: ATP-dependent DNA ligase [Methanoregula sp.]|nr:ATP-dependent DNA ligase [Methanoregula sp.]